jgi:hypothetical protein
MYQPLCHRSSHGKPSSLYLEPLRTSKEKDKILKLNYQFSSVHPRWDKDSIVESESIKKLAPATTRIEIAQQ